MKHPFLIVTICIAFVLPKTSMAQAKSAIDVITTELDRMAKTEHLSGVVLIAKDNKVLFHKAYGFANRADGVINLPNTRFNMASMTKMFTAMAILQLVESNKLSLYERVGKYLPDYPNRAVVDSVTIHQLLTHTAGLGNFWEALDKVPKEKYKSVDDYISLFSNQPLVAKPGSGYLYSNAGYILLGKLIEKTSGQSYFDYIREHILKSAQLNDTDAFELDEVHPRIATGYSMSLENAGKWINNNYVNVVKGGPAGGYYTTAIDLLRFAQAITTHKLLNKESSSLYTTGKVKYDRGSYAYGISTDTINGHGIFGHTGGHFGIANEFFICPDLGYTVVMMTNGEVENYWEVSNLIKSLLLGSSPATEKYFFTKKTIATTVKNGEEAGYKLALEGIKKNQLRESVIDRWAFHLLFDQKVAEAISLFQLNTKCFPESASAMFSLAEGYRLTAAKEKAKLAYQQYLKLEPNDEEVRAKLNSLTLK